MDYLEEYSRWCGHSGLSAGERRELADIQGDEARVKARFYAPLAFGTAGLRGQMGMGTAYLNCYTVRHATQGFANVILKEGPDFARRGVCVCYDCRHHSREFAEQAAGVLAANGIPVYLFAELRPTPELSFAVRHLDCAAGINITASHNPPSYNGYKVYWAGGAQLPTEQASRVAREMAGIDVLTGAKHLPFDQALDQGLIRLIGPEMDEQYMDAVRQSAIFPDVWKERPYFPIVYTPFHGTGGRIFPRLMERLGFHGLHCVSEQMEPDGDFPTVDSPNPEEKAGFALACNLAEQVGAALVLGTDPDADRLGIMVRRREGGYGTLTGNQVGVLLTEYLLSGRARAGTLPPSPAVIKTIVTTEMARVVAEDHGARCYDTFTGFKYMAALFNRLEAEGRHQPILAYEESYGYLIGGHCRDKDGIVAAMLVAELAAKLDLQGLTLLDAMERLSQKYGYFHETTLNLMMPGLDGAERMAATMAALRRMPPKVIGDCPVVAVRDYLSGTRLQLNHVERSRLSLSGSNVLYYELDDGSAFVIRPSGTEPKLKVYILTRGASAQAAADAAGRYACDAPAILRLQ